MSILAVGVLLLVRLAVAQNSNATCSPLFNWANNKESESPCVVAAKLESLCSPRPVTVPTLPAGYHYLGPQLPSLANECLCNTVTYSLVSACGSCQGALFANWTDWSTNCSQVAIAFFPREVPDYIHVPQWAFINISQTNNAFDIVSAQTNASAVAASSPTLSSTTSTPTTAPTDVPQMTPIATPASSSKVNAGAIAGGVVGGLFLLTGIGLAIFWFIVRKRRQRAQVPPSERYHPDFGSEPMPMSPQMGQHLLDRSTIATSPSISPRPYHAHQISDGSIDPVSPMSPMSPVSGIYTTFGRGSFETLPQAPQGRNHPYGPHHDVPEI